MKRERMTPALRRQQFLAIALEIARETGILGVTCYTVATRAGCHHNLVRRYMGTRPVLCDLVSDTLNEKPR